MSVAAIHTDKRFQVYLDSEEDLPELRPFPQVASQVLTACDDPNTNPQDLANIIQCDPAMSTRLLKVANSSMYGFSGEIRSVDRAIVAMGFRAIKSMAVSIAAAGVFESDCKATNAESKKLWLHSLATGTISSLISKHAKVKPEEAFLAGVVHDVGKLVFLDIASNEYVDSLSSSSSSDRTETESKCYGIDHQQIGERCADEWGLPGEVHSAISCHHAPENAIDCEDVAGVVCVSNCLARFWKLGGAQGSTEDLEAAVERSGIDVPLSEFEGEFQEKAIESFSALRSACA